jgi:hypothetical protein
VKVGAAKVDITPPLGCRMGGFEARTRGARAIVAEGDDGTTVALMVADLLQVDRRLQAQVAAEVEERTGIPRELMQLAGTHTHSGPAQHEPSEVERTIGHRIADAVTQAWQTRREAALAADIFLCGAAPRSRTT